MRKADSRGSLAVPAQRSVNGTFCVGQRCLRALAAEYRVLDLRIERILELRVEGQWPVAGELVGMLELRLQHLRSQRIVLAQVFKSGPVRRDVPGQQLAALREPGGPFGPGQMLDESPGEIGILGALGDSEAVV